MNMNASDFAFIKNYAQKPIYCFKLAIKDECTVTPKLTSYELFDKNIDYSSKDLFYHALDISIAQLLPIKCNTLSETFSNMS